MASSTRARSGGKKRAAAGRSGTRAKTAKGRSGGGGRRRVTGWATAVPEAQRWLLLAGLAGTALLFWRGTADPFVAPKFAWLLVVTVGLAASAVGRWLVRGGLEIPRTWLWIPLGVLLAGVALSVAASPTPLRSLVGAPGRYTGAATYLAGAVGFSVAVRRFDVPAVRTLLRGLVVIGAPVAGYALLQAAGVHVFDWTTFEGGPQVVSTFGNANFAAAWLALTLPAGLWVALDDTSSTGWRIGGAVVTALAGVAALTTGSLQGPMAGAAGVAAVLAAVAAGWEARRRLAAGVLAGMLVVGALVGLLGPARDQAAASLDSRTPKWEAAVDMVAARPLVGVGFDRYDAWYHRYREPDVAAEDGLSRTVDDAHAVPLQIAAGGGVLAGLGYVAFVLGVGWALVRGWRRAPEHEDDATPVADRRRLLGAMGGIWLAYQVQSLVSIDVPPLAFLHFVIAGAVVAVALRPPRRSVALPWGPVTPSIAAGVAVLIGLVALWPATAPWRAELDAGAARDHAAAGDVGAAVESYADAAATAPWEDRYPAAAAALTAQAGAYEQTIELLRSAIDRDDRDLAHVLNLARVLVAIGEDAEARRWYERALLIDPVTPAVADEASAAPTG